MSEFWNEVWYEVQKVGVLPGSCHPGLQVDSRQQLNSSLARLTKKDYIDNLIKRGINIFNTGSYKAALKVFNDVLILDPLNKTAQEYKIKSKEILSKKEFIVKEEGDSGTVRL